MTTSALYRLNLVYRLVSNESDWEALYAARTRAPVMFADHVVLVRPRGMVGIIGALQHISRIDDPNFDLYALLNRYFSRSLEEYSKDETKEETQVLLREAITDKKRVILYAIHEVKQQLAHKDSWLQAPEEFSQVPHFVPSKRYTLHGAIRKTRQIFELEYAIHAAIHSMLWVQQERWVEEIENAYPGINDDLMRVLIIDKFNAEARHDLLLEVIDRAKEIVEREYQ
jgi:hypothetical protein